MIVYPAIDIRGGRAVRLVQGDFTRETVFDDDPADAARRWATLGAEWLHVVDLDATVAGEPVNREAIEAIVKAVNVPVQLGGGMRTIESIANAFALGVARIVVGTKAVSDPAFVDEGVTRWGERIAVGLDARDGMLASKGWLEQSSIRATDVASRMHDSGVEHFIYTDIARDGTLSGPNITALEEMVTIAGDRVVASGGIGSIVDVEAVRDVGARGVIIGRALYDGRVDLGEAIKRAAPVQVPS